eukprot:CAMPEP_0117423956 /NCGR_PEP_ID=MMETSP0758-20121206/4481_1 /TAXON_ID=63605 /ORGANISM="Percolomonas cosmopolitus, Strain AE-1 (ATCC 50343)" /LENGTH=506 /DNA_ID=CAMNT_0005207465 /DNA_START=1271 /DNA_END=2788 /DNA_ORIENTATION=+
MSESSKLKTTDTNVQQGGTGFHSYTADETEAFAEFINGQLQGDEQLQSKLPLKTPEELFEAVKDGILLCKLVNKAKAGTIDERVMNIKDKLNPWQVSENHQLFINSAKSIGCQVVNCGPNDLSAGTAHIVLGVVWQVIKIALLQDINLKEHPELVRLLKDGETLEDLLKLPAEELLIRWVNYHLANAGSERRISNFSSDIKDSEIYTILLGQICPNKECTQKPMEETEDMKNRAELMLQEADKIKCREFITPRDVVKGNSKLNLAFTANLFNNYPALEEINEEDYDFADLLDLDGEGTREERAFRFWIQSLNIDYIDENYALQNLYADLKDGIVLLHVIDHIKPGIVQWKKVKKNAKNKFQKVGNCNEYIRCAKEAGFSTVNCGGADILEGNKKLILGQTWQLMRLSVLELLKQVGGDMDGNKKVDEKDLLIFVNQKLNLSPEVTNFKDQRFGKGKLLCDLCAAVSPKSVDKEFITEGNTDEEAEQNAKYAISVARKLGGVVFLLW